MAGRRGVHSVNVFSGFQMANDICIASRRDTESTVTLLAQNINFTYCCFDKRIFLAEFRVQHTFDFWRFRHFRLGVKKIRSVKWHTYTKNYEPQMNNEYAYAQQKSIRSRTNRNNRWRWPKIEWDKCIYDVWATDIELQTHRHSLIRSLLQSLKQYKPLFALRYRNHSAVDRSWLFIFTLYWDCRGDGWFFIARIYFHSSFAFS